MPSRHNGGVIGKANTPSLSVASGIWNMNAVHRARLGNIWPAVSTGIAFGAVSGTNTFGASSTAKTVSLTIGGEANSIVIAGIGELGAVDGWSPAPTFNGVTMTQAVTRNDGTRRADLYYMLAADLPAPGTYNLSVDPVSDPRGGLWCLYLHGVFQGAPEATNSGNGTSAGWTTGITTLTNNAWVVDCLVSTDSSGYTAAGGQTERFDFNDATSSSQAGSTKVVATAGATTLGWTPSTSRAYVHVLAAFKPA